MNLRIPESKSGALPLGDTPTIKWGERWESNPRPSGPQSDALPIELLPPRRVCILARQKGLEPLTPALEGRCSIQLSYWRITCQKKYVFLSVRLRLKSGAGDGNRTHATSLEGWCSTIELHPHFFHNAK